MAVVVDNLESVNVAPELADRAAVAEATSAALQAGRQLRALLSKVEDRLRIDPRHSIREQSPELARLVGPDVTLLVHTDVPVGTLRAAPGQLEEVVRCLVANASDAMVDGGVVELRLFTLDGASSPSSPAPTVVIEVTDRGQGVDEARFFGDAACFVHDATCDDVSTRRLAVVHEIVEQLGGFVDVRSRKGEGTSFSVHLPRVEARLAEGSLTNRMHHGSRSMRSSERQP